MIYPMQINCYADFLHMHRLAVGKLLYIYIYMYFRHDIAVGSWWLMRVVGGGRTNFMALSINIMAISHMSLLR